MAGFAFGGLLELLEYTLELYSYYHRQINESRYPIILADRLKELDDKGIEFMARTNLIGVVGIADEALNFEFSITCPGGPVQWEFAQAFIKASRSTHPYLWPISRAYELRDQDGRPFINAERQATWLTDLLLMDIAKPGVGMHSALVKSLTWAELAVKFGVDIIG